MSSMLGELDRSLHLGRAKLGTKLNQIITAVNEIRGDLSASATDYNDLVTELKASVNSLVTLATEMRTDQGTNKTVIDELIATVNELITQTRPDQVLPTGATQGAGLSPDGVNPENTETDNAIVIQKNGLQYWVAAIAEIDISALTCGGDTIAQNKTGAVWHFVNTAGTADCETDKAAQDYTSIIQALAQYSVAANTLPPGTDDVCIGCQVVVENNSGAFTIGTDDPASETSVTYYSCWGLPGVETSIATFALDAAAATFTYGAGTIRLGTGTRVALTGKANVTISGSNVVDGNVGAWLFYALADDTEIAVQLGAAYADLATAQAAVRDHTPNPILPLIGVIYVENGSGADFVPGTTNLDATGITATFTVVGPTTRWLEFGRAALGQPNQVIQNASAAAISAAAPTDTTASVPADLSATAVDVLT